MSIFSSPTKRAKAEIWRKIAAKSSESTQPVIPAEGEGSLNLFGGIKKLGEKVWGWNFCVVIALGIVLYFVHSTHLRPAEVGALSWNYWREVLVIWIAAMSLTAINSEKLETIAKGATAAIQKYLVWAMAIAFLLLPAWNWIAETGKKSDLSCAQFSPEETRTCAITEEWSAPMTADRPTEEGEYNFCVTVPKGESYESKKLGVNVFQVRSTSHRAFPMRYRLLSGSCPDTL